MNPFSRQSRIKRAKVKLAGLEAKIEFKQKYDLSSWEWECLASLIFQAAALRKKIEILEGKE